MQEHIMIYHNLDQEFLKILERNAVRAVIRNEINEVLLIQTNLGDYKFPGGGIEEGENELQALIREIREECGFETKEINEHIFRIIEQKEDKHDKNTKFVMNSNYYTCTIDNTIIHSQSLDQYERDLEYKPVWIKIEKAIKENKKIICDLNRKKTMWIKRDTFVLELL